MSLIEYPQQLSLNIFVSTSHYLIKDYICFLCKGIYFEPIIDTCGHIYCKKCLELYDSSLLVCPISKQTLSTYPTKIKLIDEIIGKQLVYCKNKSQGCLWEGELIGLNNHLKDYCKKELRVSFKEGWPDNNLLVDDIYSNLGFSTIVTCEYCHLEISYLKIEFHYDVCPKKKVYCPNKCNEKIQRELLDYHIQNNCQNAQVDCKYHDLGCNAIIFRKDICYHTQTDKNEHLDLISNKLINQSKWLNKHIDTLKKQLDDFSYINKSRQLNFDLSIKISCQSEFTLLGKKRRSQSSINKQLIQLSEPIFTIPQKNKYISLFDNFNCTKGLTFNYNKATCDTTPTEHKYAFCNFTIDRKDQITKWKIKINKYSQWIGLGLCDKKVVIDNKMKFYSTKNSLNHASYLISTNGYMWNCNNEAENNKKIPLSLINNGDELDFTYDPMIYELRFNHNDYTSKISKVTGNNLVCCIVFLNMDNEVEVTLND